MNGPTEEALAAADDDCTAMNTSHTTARNKALTALANAVAADAQPQNRATRFQER